MANIDKKDYFKKKRKSWKKKYTLKPHSFVRVTYATDTYVVKITSPPWYSSCTADEWKIRITLSAPANV